MQQESAVHEEEKIHSLISNIIDKDRVVSFSDSIFAFAATLLVLKIDLPAAEQVLTPGQLPIILAHLWPQYLSNFITFLVIGYYWLNHHSIFGQLKKFDSTIVWINLLFLVFLSFLPFPVDLYGDFPQMPWVVVFYSASLAIVGYLLAALWWYASSGRRLVSPTLSTSQIRYYSAKNLVAPVFFTLSIPLVYFHPLVAQLSWVFVIVGIIVINKIFHTRKMSTIEKASV
jgi:uncharacterized membrane protein